MSTSEFPGIYRGVVHSTKDPLNQGRVKVRVPQLFGQNVTDWAWPVNLAAAEIELPAVGQGVWVAFESGDPSFPVWFGTFFTKGTKLAKVLVNNPTSNQLAEEHVVTSGGNLNLVATLVAMSNELESLQGQIDALETRVTSLETQIP